MLVARSYSYGNTVVEEKSKSVPKTQEVYPKPFGWRPASYEEHAIQFKSRESKRRGSLPKEESKAEEPLGARRTAPVDIPSPPRAQTRSTTTKRKQAHRRTSAPHDPSTLAPSVAALLAMTSIPVKKSFSHKQKKQNLPTFTRMSSEELMAEWRHSPVIPTDIRRPSQSSSDSNLEILLSFPPETEALSRSPSNESLEIDSYTPTRSPSYDSIPSLATDLDSRSFLSSWTDQSTPRSVRRRSSNLSTGSRSKPSPRTLPVIVDVVEDPLSSSELEPERFDTSASSSPSSTPTRQSRRSSATKTITPTKSPKSRITSNLTSSLMRLRSLATSTFSNFSSPTTYLPQDHLSRGLFGSSGGTYYPSEMRPKPVSGLPDPAMRRYFNPTAQFLNPPTHTLEGGTFHTHDWIVEAVDLHREAAASTLAAEAGNVAGVRVVRLQTFSSELAVKSQADAKGIVPAEPVRLQRMQQQRQREPRENNEFLRICVLEMNMRRAGKLEDEEDKATAMAMRRGRRAFWLPPRVPARNVENTAERVPVRWVGVVA